MVELAPYFVSLLLTALLGLVIRRTTASARESKQHGLDIAQLQTDLSGERRETKMLFEGCLREIGHVREDVAEIRRILLERPGR